MRGWNGRGGRVPHGSTISPSTSSGDPYALRSPNGDNDKYFNPNAGSDGSGTFANPWNALTSARVASLVAGQALWPRGGGVSYAWPDTTGANSGTSNSRILVATYPGDAQFEFTFTGNGARLGGGSYWRLQNLKLTCATTGLCTEEQQNFNGGVRSDYLDLVDITGVQTGGAYTDNQGILFCTGSTGRPRGHRIIRGSYTGPAGQVNNQSLLWFDYQYDVAIVGVLLDQSGNPIYFKHTSSNDSAFPGATIQNCIIRRGGRGVRSQANWLTIINNAFDVCGLGLDEDDGTMAGGNNSVINHNTFLNSNALGAAEATSATRCTNVTAANNALLGSSLWMDAPYEATDKNTVINYSAVEGSATSHYMRNSTQRTMASYKSTYPTQEVNGLAGTMSLVGGSNPGNTPSNWALTAGSTGVGNASDGGDRGVNAARLLTLNGWTA